MFHSWLHTPEEISAMVLGKMKVIHAVVTVPACKLYIFPHYHHWPLLDFNEGQCQATKDADQLVSRFFVLSTSMAATITYGLNKKGRESHPRDADYRLWYLRRPFLTITTLYHSQTTSTTADEMIPHENENDGDGCSCSCQHHKRGRRWRHQLQLSANDNGCSCSCQHHKRGRWWRHQLQLQLPARTTATLQLQTSSPKTTPVANANAEDADGCRERDGRAYKVRSLIFILFTADYTPENYATTHQFQPLPPTRSRNPKKEFLIASKL